ncbi:MAG: hypothetical protein F9K44_05085 [Hyphomicrobiaceae bacterium]|nr:MAG: hypothetical protein F9K44_05085 [Hyphomicrobiaceae bacterium]
MGIEGLYRAANMAGFAMAATEELPVMPSPGSRRANALYPSTRSSEATPRTMTEQAQEPSFSQRVGSFIGSFGAKQPA